MKNYFSRRHFVKNAGLTSAAVFAACKGLNASLSPVPGQKISEKITMLNRSDKYLLDDGLCNAAVSLKPRHLISLACITGGNDCPLIDAKKANLTLERIKNDPTVTIRLETHADRIPRFDRIDPEDLSDPDYTDVFNRKRDLDVLQKLGLAPGDTRRARYLFELLFNRIETPVNICSYDTEGWEGCKLAHSKIYENVRAKGWQSLVYLRSAAERDEFRQRNTKEIRKTGRLFIRPHHLMCLSCDYNGGKGMQQPRSNDTLYEIWERIRNEPDIPVTLVEGTCMACDCCDGFHPSNGRCVHSCGLIRDYKKDLDVFQKLGLMPGATMKAKDLFDLLFEKVTSTREICGYGDGIVRSEEWKICSSPEGNPGYANTRLTGIF